MHFYIPHLSEDSDLLDYPPRTRKIQRRKRKAATSDGLNDMAVTAASLTSPLKKSVPLSVMVI